MDAGYHSSFSVTSLLRYENRDKLFLHGKTNERERNRERERERERERGGGGRKGGR